MQNKNKKNIPNDWYAFTLKDIGRFFKGAGISKNQLVDAGHNAIRYGELYTRFDFQIKKIYSFIPDSIINETKKIEYGDILFAGSGETIDEIGKSAAYLMNEECYAGGDLIIFRPRTDNSLFLSYLLNIGEGRKRLRELGQGQSVVHIYKSDIESIKLHLPSRDEQNKIVAIIETWDKYLNKLLEKIEIKKNIKRGLMQKLLSGKIRLKGFAGKWQTKELGEILDYEQPTKYLVKSDNYDDSYKTPVLTANKSFVLGYTNESDGVYANTPVIIFDDFTTASKYVDFPFKVKSSAIKLLKTDHNYDTRFMFEKLQLINYAIGEHKRHYLSEFQFMIIDVPEKIEQDRISTIIKNVDNEIELISKKRALIEEQKNYLLNNLITGKIRLPEFQKVK